MACLNFCTIFTRRSYFNIYNRKVFFNILRYSSCSTNANCSSCVKLNFINHNTLFYNSNLICSGNFKFYSTEKIVSSSSTEDQENEEEKQKRAKAWQRMKWSLILMGSFFGVMSCYSFYVLGSPDRDENGNDIKDEFSYLPTIQQWFTRFYNKIRYYKKIIQEPSQDKLLPDPVQYPYVQPPYTLVIELTDLLVHPDWTYQTGWRFKKRPHVDAFLEQVGSPLFEIVIFTAEQAMTMFPIINQLNKNGLIPYTLFRDSTDFRDGIHIKNLNWLNRDLSKVIVVDWNPKSVKLHPDNAFIIPRWDGNNDDHTLLDLATFLRTIAFNKVEDVREVLSYYQQFPDPLAKFRENQQILLEQMEEQERIEQAKKEHPPLTRKFAKSYVSYER
ncbi:hypothetical protein PGB90_006939 [Kerria lacca]